MKKILLIPILLVSIILAGCSQKGLSQEDSFQRKQECASHKENIEKEIEERNREDYGVKQTLYLDSIFYSPKLNTCLYYAKGWSITDKQQIDFNIVFDYFSKEIILTTPNFCNEGKTPYGASQCGEDEIKFLNKLQELRGE